MKSRSPATLEPDDEKPTPGAGVEERAKRRRSRTGDDTPSRLEAGLADTRHAGQEGGQGHVGGAHEGAVAKTCGRELADLYEEHPGRPA